jgi:hypothetical protein
MTCVFEVSDGWVVVQFEAAANYDYARRFYVNEHYSDEAAVKVRAAELIKEEEEK